MDWKSIIETAKNLIPILVLIFTFIIALVKSLSKSEFDKKLMTRDKRFWNQSMFQLALLLTIIIYVSFFVTNKVSEPPEEAAIIVAISLTIWLLSCILVYVHHKQFKKKGYSNERSKSFKRYLFSISIISSIGSLIFIGNISSIEFNNNKEMFEYIGDIIFILMMSSVLVYYLNFLFTKFNYQKRYSFTYKLKTQDGKSFFVLHKYDSNHLLLGDNPKEFSCREIYLYNLDTQEYIAFEVDKKIIDD
jgi:uncharacterized membrane protein